MKVAWRTSARRMRVTRVPRCGRISTSPSAWRRPSASETGKARDAEPLADRLLVEIGAGRQVRPR